MLGHGKAADVANDHERVLIHGVHVKQVVLHLSYDFPEYRDVLGQNAEHSHSSETMHNASGLLQYLQEKPFIHRIAPKLRVNPVAGAPDLSLQLGRHVIDLRVLLQHQKGFKKQLWFAFECVLGDKIELLSHTAKILVYHDAAIFDREEMLPEALHHDVIHQIHNSGRPVITLHQNFTRTPGI